MGEVRSMLVDRLLQTADQSPSALAVDDGLRALTYRRMAALAAVLRNRLIRETACPRIGIMLPASAAFPATLFGTLWASRIAVPLNFLLSADELAVIVQDAGLDLIVSVKAFQGLLEKLSVRALFLEDLHLQRALLFNFIRRRPPVPTPSPDDTAVILYTSGTTARPKGVELSYRNLVTNVEDSIAALELDAHHRLLNILPPFHVFGLTAGVLIPVFAAAAVHALPRFNPLAAIKTIAAKRITMLMAIPSMYAALLRSKSASADSFASVELAVSGGEPLPESVRAGFQQRWSVTLRQGYGLTETSPVVTVCTRNSHRDGTVGRPIPHVEIRVVDAGGQPLPNGHEGEILVRGPGVMKGYYGKPEETRRIIDHEGWFHSGDIGSVDVDGFLTLTGRMKDMLIVGGENVYAREIEAVLESHESVLQAAVIGAADDLRGEVPIAFVIPRKGTQPNDSELRGFARRALAGFKVPRRIVIREDLPTGPTGKILKRKLKQRS